MTQSLGQVFWLMYAAGVSGIVLALVALWWPGGTMRHFGLPLLMLALVGIVGALVTRSIDAGRLPVIGTFENAMVAAAMIVIVAAGAKRLGPRSDRLALDGLLAPWALVMLGGGLLAPLQPLPIDAGGRAVIGYIHAFVGWLDFAFFAASVATAIGVLLNRRTEAENSWDEALARTLGLGFALLTATMVSGSIYSFMLFGEWYRWQVVETAAATAWLGYASLLHLRLLHRWRGRKLAIGTLVAFPLALTAFWVWALYPATYHYFDAVLRVR